MPRVPLRLIGERPDSAASHPERREADSLAYPATGRRRKGQSQGQALIVAEMGVRLGGKWHRDGNTE